MLAYIQANRKWYMAEGILFLILGILAIILPMIFTFAITIFLGALMVIGGISQIVQLLKTGPFPRDWASWLYAIVLLLAGGMILLSPTVGAFSLTLVLVAFFILAGIAKIILAFQYRPMRNWGWVLFSGLLSLTLAALILIGWPSTALWALGVMLGINLFFFGFSLITIVASLGKPDAA